MSIADGPATRDTRRDLVLRLAELGVPEDDRQRAVCAAWTGGPVRSRTELTERQAGSLLAQLRTMTPAELAAIAPPPPLVDDELVDDELVDDVEDQADDELSPPRPAPDPVACLASWDGPDPDVAPGSALPVPPRYTVPCALCPAVLLADTAEELRAAMDAHAADHDPVDGQSVDGVVIDRAAWERFLDEPAPVHVVTYEPPARTPQEVEKRAAAAVARFLERKERGETPTPPDLSTIPPREVVPYGNPGRYCQARCYCGTCPQYAEQAAAAEQAHRVEVNKARRSLTGP